MANGIKFTNRAAALGLFCATAILLSGIGFRSVRGADWPQWLGPQRDGVWRETGLIEKFPPGGPRVVWRAPVNAGYCGPAVVSNRVFLLDRTAGKMPERKPGDRSLPNVPGTERALCLDARTGEFLWEHIYPVGYRIDYPAGPRATPVVENDRVYTLGAMGDLRCLQAADGQPVWRVNFVDDFKVEPPVWGWANHPLIYDQYLICLVGGTNSAVVAFDKRTGRVAWQSLTAAEICYAPPMIYAIDGQPQLIIWHSEAVVGLEPKTGRTLWTHPYPAQNKPRRPAVNIAAPKLNGRRLLLTQYYHGSMLLEISSTPSAAKLVWARHGKIGSDFSDGLHTLMCPPIFHDEYFYGWCADGELRCLNAATGDRVWETYAVVGGKRAPLSHAFLVEQGERCWIWTDHGELILARLAPGGYTELDRTKLLEPQENTRGRDVLWCHPAFADRRMFVHNGKELICVSLAKAPAAN